MIPELTPVQRICGTSVEDAFYDINRTTNIELLKECIVYERKERNRAGMIKMLERRIRKLERATT